MKSVIKIFIPVFGIIFLSCTWNTQKDNSFDVKIVRDRFGVPHIYAQNTYSLFYGYGYSVAQDRLFQMEMIKRSTRGSVAEVLGSSYLAFDQDVRTNIDFRSINRQYQELKKEDKAIFEGYAQGINAWIDSIQNRPHSLMPKQFIDFSIKPTYWNAIDVIIVFVGTMCNRYSDFTTEIENARFLQRLEKKYGIVKATQLFNQVLWKYDPEARTTITEKSKRVSMDSSIETEAHYRRLKTVKHAGVYQKDQPFLHPDFGKPIQTSKEQRYINRLTQLGKKDPSEAGGYPACSNIVVVGKKKAKGANAMILNGPQFGWFTPSYVYGIGLHGAGYNVVGNTPFAYPVVLFGCNEHIGWGATAGMGDIVDIFEEQLNETNSNQYFFNGTLNEMEISYDTIKIKDEPDVVHKKYRTVHGHVVVWDTKNNIAYTKKRSWDGHEVATLMGWINSTKTKHYKEWNKQASNIAISINWYYADRLGNIGYVHNGKLPKRSKKSDFRLPGIGDGTMEWEGIEPFKKNPQVYNPRSGYIVNWNNAPEKNYNSPDMFWLQWSKADRVALLERELNQAGRLGPTEVKNLIQRAAFKDVNYDHIMPLVKSCLKGITLTKEENMLVTLMEQWDGFHTDLNKDEYYDDVGYTVFKFYLETLQKQIFKDDIPDPFYSWYASAGYRKPNEVVFSAGSNLQPGTKALYKILSDSSKGAHRYDFLNGMSKSEMLKKCLKITHTKITDVFTTQDPSKWLSPVPKNYYLTSNFLGIPQANKNEIKTNAFIMNRGTENNLIVCNTDALKFYDVISPGQSGFINPNGEKSKHYEDQLRMYEMFEYKKVSTSTTEILQNTEVTHLIIKHNNPTE